MPKRVDSFLFSSYEPLSLIYREHTHTMANALIHFILPWELTLLSNIQSENLSAFHYCSAEVLTRIFQGPVFLADIKGKKCTL